MLALRIAFYFLFPNWGNFKEQWWYYLSFSCLFYYIGITGYTNNVFSIIPFRLSLLEKKPVYLINYDLTLKDEDADEEEFELIDEEVLISEKINHTVISEWKNSPIAEARLPFPFALTEATAL